MSKFTTQLRWIVEQEQGDVPYSSDERYIQRVYKKLGLDSYPIFDEEYRTTLNDKIIDHFFFREIGFETAAQFQWYMRRTLNEIMPYYNELYKALLKIDDPLTNRDLKWNESWDINVEDGGTITDRRTGGVETQEHDRNVFQDTPMSLLDNSHSPTVQGLDYATNVTYDDNNTSTDRHEQDTKTLDTDKHDHGWRVRDEKGRTKSPAELMKEYIDMFVNIDVRVLRDLEPLFMGLW